MQLDEIQAYELKRTWRIRFFPSVEGVTEVEGYHAELERFTQHLPGRFMPLGAYSYSHSFFGPVSKIGRYCSIGTGVEAMGNAHPTDWISSNPAFYRPRRSRMYGSHRTEFPPFDDAQGYVEIGHDVWIGDDALLAHGVKIGTGAIIAARSVVTRDVPPYAIVAGVPAKMLRLRFDEALVERLLKSQWWQWPISTWDDIDPRNVEAFLDHADEIADTVAPMPEERIAVIDILRQL